MTMKITRQGREICFDGTPGLYIEGLKDELGRRVLSPVQCDIMARLFCNYLAAHDVDISARNSVYLTARKEEE